jgi:hypothetical protein
MSDATKQGRKTSKTTSWAAKARKAAKKDGTKRHPAASGGKWLRPSKRLSIYHRNGFACVCCGRGAEEGVQLTVDHLLAVELGGDNSDANLITLCMDCNVRKSSSSIRAWFQALRDQGVDTSLIARCIRRTLRTPLDRAEGRRLLSLRRTSATK